MTDRKIKTILSDLAEDVADALRATVMKLEIYNRCLISSNGFDERMRWAEEILRLEVVKSGTFLDLAAQALNVERSLVGRSLVVAPALDQTGTRLSLIVWDDEVETAPPGKVH